MSLDQIDTQVHRPLSLMKVWQGLIAELFKTTSDLTETLYAMKLMAVLLVMICNRPSVVTADIDSGCPSWGCLSSGSFSLSSGVPQSNVIVKWSTEIAHVLGRLHVSSLRGCVSDQMAVVCSTHGGYASLDPVTGQQLWNTTSMEYPYLPVMDVFGDIIGMDENQLVYVDESGFSMQAINVSAIKPAFSVMLANNSILLVASQQTDTPQIVIYKVGGIICAAISLRDTVNNVNGTFIPTGHPIIVGYRAYVITQFAPAVASLSKINTDVGTYRLYALDLWNRMGQRIKIAWYFNMEPEKPNVNYQLKSNGEELDKLPSVVAYLRGIVYVNIPIRSSSQGHVQTFDGALWGIKDNGGTSSFLFKNIGTYGQMVVYDTFYENDARQHVEADQTIWISSSQQSLISGYSSKNGSFSGYINVSELTNIDLLTSKLAITRQSPTSLDDVLVFGGTDGNGTAYLVALEASSSAHTRLLWKTKLSNERPLRDNVTWEITGQIVNIVQDVTHMNGALATWQTSVVAMVLENGHGYNKLHIKAVY